MSEFTLAQIAAFAAGIDGIEVEQFTAYEKSLRNLVQRHFLPPISQHGRVFLYDRGGAVTIRLAHIAAEFGIPRTTIDSLTRWLSGSGTRRKPTRGGFVGLSQSDEAIERVENGEVFALHIIMTADRSVSVQADWKKDTSASEKVESALQQRGQETGMEIARFTLPAANIIAQFLPPMTKD
ncbi:hypothetical protein [Cypionkella psychrotolerans]|uniref:hypothetical protein n=1 Tax=Cypionkella psychrotolerans TaxID=1678131 RepID=UPI0006B5C15E|nr:hypothetical protein [Cypionkella psychrotolerans]